MASCVDDVLLRDGGGVRSSSRRRSSFASASSRGMSPTERLKRAVTLSESAAVSTAFIGRASLEPCMRAPKRPSFGDVIRFSRRYGPFSHVLRDGMIRSPRSRKCSVSRTKQHKKQNGKRLVQSTCRRFRLGGDSALDSYSSVVIRNCSEAVVFHMKLRQVIAKFRE